LWPWAEKCTCRANSHPRYFSSFHPTVFQWALASSRNKPAEGRLHLLVESKSLAGKRFRVSSLPRTQRSTEIRDPRPTDDKPRRGAQQPTSYGDRPEQHESARPLQGNDIPDRAVLLHIQNHRNHRFNGRLHPWLRCRYFQLYWRAVLVIP
jgi:hypothetical protein